MWFSRPLICPLRSSVDGIWWSQPDLKPPLDPHLSTFQSSSGHNTLGTWARTYSAALLGTGEMVNNLTAHQDGDRSSLWQAMSWSECTSPHTSTAGIQMGRVNNLIFQTKCSKWHHLLKFSSFFPSFLKDRVSV